MRGTKSATKPLAVATGTAIRLDALIFAMCAAESSGSP